jgi:prophage regulatory protein
MPNENKVTVGGFLRLNQIIAPNGPIPVSRSTWWAGVKSGRFPAPVKLGPRITAWRDVDIAALVVEISSGARRSTAVAVPNNITSKRTRDPEAR